MRTTTPKRPEGIGEEAVAVVRALAVPSKMMAAVLYGSEDLRLEKIDVPLLAADEVLLRVRLALTDGTDLKVWQRGYHARMIQPPAVFGNEAVGEIASVGKRVDARWRIGLRVVAANSAPCLRCYHCRRARENLCEALLFNNGAYAEYWCIPSADCLRDLLWRSTPPRFIIRRSRSSLRSTILRDSFAKLSKLFGAGTSWLMTLLPKKSVLTNSRKHSSA